MRQVGKTTLAKMISREQNSIYLDLESPEDLFRFYPGVFDKVNLTKIEVPFMKASEDMDFKDWQKIQ